MIDTTQLTQLISAFRVGLKRSLSRLRRWGHSFNRFLDMENNAD